MEKLATSTVNSIKSLIEQASQTCMEIYSREFRTDYKADNSPVTEADLAVNRIISEGLAQITPHIPVISEETTTPFEIRKDYRQYWLLDPIDGTKEFVRRTGEFTINLGLVRDGVPCFGFICIPATGQLYYGGTAHPTKWEAGGRLLGAWAARCESFEDGAYLLLMARKEPLKVDADNRAIVLACSRSHRSPRDERLILNLAQEYFVNTFYSGSTIKVCRVAEGRADAYVRFQGLYDWDLAAAHAIAIAAGADVYDEQGEPVVYNTPDQRIKPFAVSAPSLPKETLLSYACE